MHTISLSDLVKEPVLQDKRQEHVKFCKYAVQLLQRVSGNMPNTFDASLEDIRKVGNYFTSFFLYKLIGLI